jgi:phosphoglycolate phosphatase-like HAD superfamily hydrolase
MNMLNNYKVAIFDCDGVILNSNQVKSNAFSLALHEEDSNLVREFIEYHQENGGVSRYIKFEYFFTNIKKCSNYKKDLELALKRYAVLSKEGLLKCSEVPGIRQILHYFNSNNVPCYVASGGDQNEVISVLKHRELFGYFKGVYGSPLSKIENLGIIEGKQELHKPGLFFGDARSDMLAAKHYNLKFIFVAGFTEWEQGFEYCRSNKITICDNFKTLMGS